MFVPGYIQLHKEKLHYLRIGRGRKLLIAFHGYGNDAEIFLPFENYLNDFTIISIDLPYHGKSEWGTDEPLQKDDLVALVNELMKDCHVDKVNLAGYSIGARACLCIIEQMPERVDKVLLIAPDGLVHSSFYHFVTMTTLGKRLFRDFLKKPQQYMPLINAFKKMKVISAGRYKYAMHYINKEAERELLLKVWPNMRLIIPDLQKLKKTIEEYKIPVHIFIGSYDKIIPLNHAKRFSKKMTTVQTHVFDKGHWLLDEETISKMAKCLIA